MYYDVVAKLAKKKGISTISKWQNTKPNIGNLEKVAKCLEVSVVDIIKACEKTNETEV